MAAKYFGFKNYITNGGKMYNCSEHPYEYWVAKGHKDVFVGLFYLASGIAYQLLYIPCMMVITQKSNIKHSCYKIMCYLGIIDIICLFVNADISGYLSIVGGNYCTHEDLVFISGAIAMGMWTAACFTCMLLAINRCVDLWSPHLMEQLFAGSRTWYWLIAPTLYMLFFTFFEKPLIYDSRYYAWFFDPHVHDVNETQSYENFPHTVNNGIVMVGLSTLYISLCSLLFYRSRMSTSSSVSAIQRQIVLQSCLICIINLMAASIYVWMQYFSAPDILIVISQIAWQGCHGSVAVVYLTMNKTMRRGVLKVILPERFQKSQVGPTGQLPTTGCPTKEENTVHII